MTSFMSPTWPGRTLKSDATDEFFNIGMGVKTTISELVESLLEITGSDLRPEYRPQEQMFVTHRVGSTEKAEQEVGFRASVPLAEGLRSVVEWRQDQQAFDEARKLTVST